MGFPSGDSHMPRVMIPHWCHGPPSASTWELEMVVARRRREAAERCQDGGLCLWGPHVVVEVVVEPSRDTECGPHQEFRLLAWSCNYKRDLHHLKSFSHTHNTHLIPNFLSCFPLFLKNRVLCFSFLCAFVVKKKKMTNQNVVVSDGKSGINMAITVAVSGSSLYPPAAQKPPAVPGTYITISKKKLLQNLDINGGGARINAWVDSMRSSSPTHLKSTPPLSDDQTSWTVSPTKSLQLCVCVRLYVYVYRHIHTWYMYMYMWNKSHGRNTEEHIRGMCIRHAVVHVLTSVGIPLFLSLYSCFSLFSVSSVLFVSV